MEQGWGGRESHKKRQLLYEDIITEFNQSNKTRLLTVAGIRASFCLHQQEMLPRGNDDQVIFVSLWGLTGKMVDVEDLACTLCERLTRDFSISVEDDSDVSLPTLFRTPICLKPSNLPTRNKVNGWAY